MPLLSDWYAVARSKRSSEGSDFRRPGRQIKENRTDQAVRDGSRHMKVDERRLLRPSRGPAYGLGDLVGRSDGGLLPEHRNFCASGTIGCRASTIRSECVVNANRAPAPRLRTWFRLSDGTFGPRGPPRSSQNSSEHSFTLIHSEKVNSLQ